MDAETRRTLAAMVLSMLIRVSFVFLALRERENGSVQKTNEKMKRERKNERQRGEEKRRGKRSRKIISFLIF